uniref:Internal scaffolding protein n=1 Tax=Dulem virus 135 TaxID=3145612 RepID=A0AAU8B3K9_9VIRU
MLIVKVFSPFEEIDFKSSPTGDGLVPEFALDEKGELVETGKHSLYMEIQSHRDECTVETLLARAMNGDLTALNKRDGFYGDITSVPTSISEVSRHLDDFNELKKQVPSDILSALEKAETSEAVSKVQADFLAFLEKQKELKQGGKNE